MLASQLCFRFFFNAGSQLCFRLKKKKKSYSVVNLNHITNLGAVSSERRPAAGAALPDAEDSPVAPGSWPPAGLAGSAELPPPPGVPPALPAGGPWLPAPGARISPTTLTALLLALKVDLFLTVKGDPSEEASQVLSTGME